MMYFPVVEAFKSLQGEGPSAGHPAFFLRVKRCNYSGKCPVGCDTIPRTKYLAELHIPYGSVAEYAWECGRLIITGGEPLLYLDQVVDLLQYLDNEFFHSRFPVEIETNGYNLPLFFEKMPCYNSLILQINYSPKEYEAISTSLLLEECDLSKVDKLVLKIVVWNDQKVLEFVEDMVKSDFKDKIWLMPRGKTVEELEKNWPVAIDLALEYNLKVTGRMQIEAKQSML